MTLIINGKIITEKDETKNIAEKLGGGGGGTSYTFHTPLRENNTNVFLDTADNLEIDASNKLRVTPRKFMEYRDYITSIGQGNQVEIGELGIPDKINNNTTMIINLVSSDWNTYNTRCNVQLQWNKNGDSSEGWIKLIVDWKDEEELRTIFLQHFEAGEFETHTFFNAWGDDEGPFEIYAEGGNFWELAAITGDNATDYYNMPLFTDAGNMYLIEDADVTTREQYNRNFVYSVNWNITGGTGTQSQYIASADEFDRIEDFAFLFDVITYRFCYVTARFRQGANYIINYIIISGN